MGLVYQYLITEVTTNPGYAPFVIKSDFSYPPSPTPTHINLDIEEPGVGIENEKYSLCLNFIDKTCKIYLFMFVLICFIQYCSI